MILLPKWRIFIIGLLSIFFLILLWVNWYGIFYYNSIQNHSKDKIKKIRTVGISLGTLKEERWIKDRDILSAKLKERGMRVLIQNANNDDQDQIKQVRNLLDEGIDILIIVPNDLDKAKEAVVLAKQSGVKVIAYDRLVVGSNVDLYISFDNVKVGRLMAEYTTKMVPKGNYLIINGAMTDHNTHMIKEGYEQILKPFVENQAIHIVQESWAPNWLAEHAFQITDNLLQKGHIIHAVIAGDDALAGGVIEALAEYRKAGGVVVVAQDADLAACQRIIGGTQAMTVYKPIEQLAEKTAELTLMLANDQALPVHQTIFDGLYEVPYVKLEPLVVDRGNIDDTVIADGFHTAEDIYGHIKK